MSQPAEPNQPHRPYPRVLAYPAKPRRHRPANPYAAANELAMKHKDIADKVAANLSRRTGHPAEDLWQISMMGIIQASRRYMQERGDFRRYARSYANNYVFHFLRDRGFLIKVPPSWRETHARGRKLLRLGAATSDIPKLLNITPERWSEIVLACNQRVVAFEYIEEQSD